MVQIPTRDKNILDLFMVNDPSQLTDLQVIEHFGHSDHNMITFNINAQFPGSLELREKFSCTAKATTKA